MSRTSARGLCDVDCRLMPWCSDTLGGCRHGREAGLTGRWSPLLAAALLGSEPPRTLHTIPLPACPRPAKVLSSPELQTLSHSSHHTLQLATIQRRVDFPRSRFPFASPCRLPFPCHTAFRVFPLCGENTTVRQSRQESLHRSRLFISLVRRSPALRLPLSAATQTIQHRRTFLHVCSIQVHTTAI